MSSTTTSKVKKKTKKTPISTASTAPEDYEFGPTTSFTAGETQDSVQEIMRQFKDFIAKNEKNLQQNNEAFQRNSEALLSLAQSQQRIEEHTQMLELQQKMIERQEVVIKYQQASIDTLTTRVTSLQSAINILTIKSTTTPTFSQTSYASAAAAPVSSFPPSPPSTRSPTPRPETASCIIDLRQMDESEKTSIKIRRGIESEVQKELGTIWKCTAVLRDSARPDRLKIVCNTKEELEKVKKATSTTIPRAKVVSDPLYPIKIDNVRTSSVLHPDGTIKDIKDMLSEENNNIEIARLGWLSAKQTGKAFGSMVIYLIKKSEAQRILQKGFFDVCGESAYARVFERHPPKCFSCQKEGHIARNCTEPATESGEMDSTN